jgi:hypothetical protein
MEGYLAGKGKARLVRMVEKIRTPMTANAMQADSGEGIKTRIDTGKN